MSDLQWPEPLSRLSKPWVVPLRGGSMSADDAGGLTDDHRAILREKADRNDELGAAIRALLAAEDVNNE